MINNMRTFGCVLCGLFIGGAFMAQAWGVLLVFFLLVLPYEHLGRTVRQGIVEMAKWLEERKKVKSEITVVPQEWRGE